MYRGDRSYDDSIWFGEAPQMCILTLLYRPM